MRRTPGLGAPAMLDAALRKGAMHVLVVGLVRRLPAL